MDIEGLGDAVIAQLIERDLVQSPADLYTLGWEALHTHIFWWAVAMLPFNAALNVGVSFYLAFRVALRAHNVSGVDRSRIYAAIRRRMWRSPLSFFWP